MKTKVITMLYLLLFLFISSCGSDVDCSETNLDQNWAAELQAAINAGNAYYSDETSVNCSTYKNALNAYLNIIKDYRSCANNSSEEAQFDETIQDAENELNEIDC